MRLHGAAALRPHPPLAMCAPPSEPRKASISAPALLSQPTISISVGVVLLLALVTNRRVWYYPAMLLLLLTAIGRILAWLFHDAALATELIAPEIFVFLILLVASRRLPDRE